MSTQDLLASPAKGPPASAGVPRRPVASPPASPRAQPPADHWRDALAGAVTMAVWLGCLVVGTLGLLLHYGFTHAPAPPSPPVSEVIRLAPPPAQAAPARIQPPTPTAKSESAPPPPAVVSEPPPPPDLAAPPAAPALAAVAEPSPAIAFAVPVAGPSRIVDARQAIPPAAARVAPPQPSIRHLTFGVGEGRQPPPEYPREAQIAGEQGTVLVRFVVGPDGRVHSAAVEKACRWPQLNQAALQAVRSWSYPPGKVQGDFDIPIDFILREQ